MADAAWSYWYDEVARDVPGAGLAVIQHAVRRAAIDFCDQSCAWRKAVPSIASVANTGEYTLPAVATGVMVVRLKEARWLGLPLDPLRPDELKAYYDPTDWRTVTGSTPDFYTQETPNTIRLVPAPDNTTAAAINGLWAACKPKDDATGIDQAVATEHFQAIAEGAKAKLFASPAKPYSNPTLAAAYDEMFKTAIGDASFRAFRGNGGRQRTRTYFL